ncbi:MAG: Uma2 family endonuclease [Nostoc sp. LLA-1]|nr:Uma2 family endonuclease [Cyanocohniella sp. LLY]
MYQTDPPRSAEEVLPTMYDLKSEDPEEPGLPDQFHLLQPRLLDETFASPSYPSDKIFTASDMNLYYDPHHPTWYKRPDWFVAVDVSPLYKNGDLRLSYVVWQEGISPFIIVELLSPGTEREDLGQTLRDAAKPPTKWEVYEQILRIPYYAIFDRYKYEFRIFKLDGGRYAEVSLSDSRFWIPEIELGLGVWQGSYHNIQQPWLRWYDTTGNWVLTPTEQERKLTEQERQRTEQERRQKERLIEQLRSLGVEPDLD